MRYHKQWNAEIKPQLVLNPTARKKPKDYSVATTNEILRELKQSFPTLQNKMPKKLKKTVLKEFCLKMGVLHSIDERVALKRALVRRKIDFKHDAHTFDLVSLAMSHKLNFDTIG